MYLKQKEKKYTKQKGKEKHATTLGTKHIFICMRSSSHALVQAVGRHEKCSIREVGKGMYCKSRSLSVLGLSSLFEA